MPASNKCGAQEVLHQLSFSHHSSGHESPRREAKAGVYEYVARLSVLAIVLRLLQCISRVLRMSAHHSLLHGCCMLGTLDWTASVWLNRYVFPPLQLSQVIRMFLAQLERSLEPLCRYIEAPVYGSINAGRVSCISFAKVFRRSLAGR